jgi:hypothetical protein
VGVIRPIRRWLRRSAGSGWLAFPLGTNQLHESDLRSFIPQRTGCPLGKELTVANVTRLAIENVEEIFLQGFAASPRFA